MKNVMILVAMSFMFILGFVVATSAQPASADMVIDTPTIEKGVLDDGGAVYCPQLCEVRTVEKMFCMKAVNNSCIMSELE